MDDMASDEEVGRQILSIFMQHKVGATGVLRRNSREGLEKFGGWTQRRGSRCLEIRRPGPH